MELRVDSWRNIDITLIAISFPVSLPFRPRRVHLVEQIL